MKKTWVLAVICLGFSMAAQAQVRSEVLVVPGIEHESDLFRETPRKQGTSYSETEIQPLVERRSTTSRGMRDVYSSWDEFRRSRRVGVSFATFGQLGFLGAQVDLGFGTRDSAVIGFGGSDRYSSYMFSWKHVLTGNRLTSYTNLGLSHWSSGRAKGPISSISPNVLQDRYLSEDEKGTGYFAKTFLTPGFGLQYNLFSGPYVGWSMFTEIVLLMEISDITPSPLGSVGLSYYF